MPTCTGVDKSSPIHATPANVLVPLTDVKYEGDPTWINNNHLMCAMQHSCGSCKTARRYWCSCRESRSVILTDEMSSLLLLLVGLIRDHLMYLALLLRHCLPVLMSARQRRYDLQFIMPLPIIGRGIKRCFCLMSVCLSRTLGLSREQRGVGRLELAQR